MSLTVPSPCKVNLVLNILGRRPDGYHELETLFLPVPVCDQLVLETAPAGIHLTCSHPDLPTDATNLVHRAATAFLDRAGVSSGVAIHLDKRLPLASGIGGGSSNAACTLLGLNELLGRPLALPELHQIAATLGSDVNFFLQNEPALATGRGESIRPTGPFAALRGTAILLFHPGFGIPTPWAFRELARFPDLLQGRPGRASALAERLRTGTDAGAALDGQLFNALETPAFLKYPILILYQEFFRGQGCLGTLMSGSGSTTFALFGSRNAADAAASAFRAEFGETGWLAVADLGT